MSQRNFLKFLRTFVILTMLIVEGCISSDSTPTHGLGKIDFATSAQSKEVQDHFTRGVAALHCFWYDVAIREFQESTRLEPRFAMGYWGQAMTYNHPIWNDLQELDSARSLVAKIPTDGISPRERGYLDAVRALYGRGEQFDRESAYVVKMRDLHEKYPDDPDAATFLALALLGSIHADDPSSLKKRMEAAAIAIEVLSKIPTHPGAAHYIIHALDDPDHAILALPAARRLPLIAPEAPHALHMPVHTYFQLAMWPEAVRVTEASRQASEEIIRKDHLPPTERDYHNISWLFYAYLQQGRYRAADDLLNSLLVAVHKSIDSGVRDGGFGSSVADISSMMAMYEIESEKWDSTISNDSSADRAFDSLHAEDSVVLPVTFARAFASAKRGLETTLLMRKLNRFSIATQEAGHEFEKILKIQQLEVSAVAAVKRHDIGNAEGLMNRAIKSEDSLPKASGPPDVIKPAHELFGEILLKSGKFSQAQEQFDAALRRYPGRSRSVLGLARAKNAMGAKADAQLDYAQFLKLWSAADVDRPELQEARKFIERQNGLNTIPH